MNKKKSHYKKPLAYYDLAVFLKDYIDDDTIIVCIGTDRCIGDCLGPLVGTYLREHNFPLPVFGTISSPIHALNIDKKMEDLNNLYPSHKTIGIDACLGDEFNIGEIQVRDFPIHPGKGVGKSLPQVGEASLIGIVDSSDSDELFSSRSIRLNLIMSMSKVICNAIIHSYYLYKLDNPS